MATVRIFKVAELLGTTSQEVLQLLKQNHGIELKSASSTVEEIVARQFVERLARQRGIELPKGDMFSDAAVKSARARTAAAPKKGQPAPEPPKPAAPRAETDGAAYSAWLRYLDALGNDADCAVAASLAYRSLPIPARSAWLDACRSSRGDTSRS